VDQNLLNLVKASFSLWVIIACSVIAVAVTVERAIALWGFGEKARSLADAVGRALYRGDLDDGRAQCERSGSMAAEVFLAGLVALMPKGATLSGRPAGEPNADRLAAAVERERQRVNMRMRRGLWILGTVGATAPFVGLFGTVVGIMNAFHDMAHTGQGGFAVVSAGISEALITTAAGIAVAVLAVVLFNLLNTHAQKLTLQLRLLTEEYLELVRELLPALKAGAPARTAGGEG
jgi:biopolymer transport protein ExbB